MRVFFVCALLGAVSVLGFTAGCNDSGIGKSCLINTVGDAGLVGTKIASPSLECLSRLCYQQQGASGQPDRWYCTARCNSDDDCKGGLTEGNPGEGPRCPPPSDKKDSAFVCAISTDVGPFACQAFCVCRADLVRGVNLADDGHAVTCPQKCQTGGGTCPTGK